jgi:Xaa-Pro aminopeptidase
MAGSGGGGTVLERLRAVMRSSQYVSEPLAAYIVPTDDAHQNEYIADCDKRREFITGFTGSAGVPMHTPCVQPLLYPYPLH